MKNESDFKKVFKKSVKHYGGYAMSLACPTFNGIPDLAFILPNKSINFIEAKFVKDIKNTKFRRKLNITALQRDWLKEFNLRRSNCAMILVGLVYHGDVYAILYPYYQESIDENFTGQPHVKYDRLTKSFPLDQLFPSFG